MTPIPLRSRAFVEARRQVLARLYPTNTPMAEIQRAIFLATGHQVPPDTIHKAAHRANLTRPDDCPWVRRPAHPRPAGPVTGVWASPQQRAADPILARLYPTHAPMAEILAEIRAAGFTVTAAWVQRQADRLHLRRPADFNRVARQRYLAAHPPKPSTAGRNAEQMRAAVFHKPFYMIDKQADPTLPPIEAQPLSMAEVDAKLAVRQQRARELLARKGADAVAVAAATKLPLREVLRLRGELRRAAAAAMAPAMAPEVAA